MCSVAPLMLCTVLVLGSLPAVSQTTYEPYFFGTLAGSVGYGSDDGVGSAARFHFPGGVATGSDGLMLCVGHVQSHLAPADDPG